MLVRFALAVERRARAGAPASAIAAELGCAESDVLNAPRLLAVPTPGECEPRKTALTEAERAELREKIPKEWQERYAKSKSLR